MLASHTVIPLDKFSNAHSYCFTQSETFSQLGQAVLSILFGNNPARFSGQGLSQKFLFRKYQVETPGNGRANIWSSSGLSPSTWQKNIDLGNEPRQIGNYSEQKQRSLRCIYHPFMSIQEWIFKRRSSPDHKRKEYLYERCMLAQAIKKCLKCHSKQTP